MPRTERVEVEVFEKQMDLINLIRSEEERIAVLYGGAMGGGKSYGIALAGAALSAMWPGNRGFIGRNDFKDLRETTYETCIDVWGDLGIIEKHHKSEHWVRFTNSSEVLFGELKDPESRKSLNLGWFAVDEGTEIMEKAYTMLLSRLRWRLPPDVVKKYGQIRYRAILCSNPEPGWVKRRFVDEPRKEGYYFIRSLPDDNPELPADYVEWLREQFTEMWIKRYLGGSWDAFEGAVFVEFDRAVHVLPAMAPSPSWNQRRAIDHGLRNPTCCLWLGVGTDQVIHVFDEHYLAGQPVSYHGAAIKAKSDGRPILTVIDPSTAAVKDIKNGQAWSVQKEYLTAGIPTTLANNARMAGINRIKELLKAKQLVIHENCVNLLRELPEYEWKEVNTADVDQPEDAVKKDDHAIDALRYGVVALRPITPTDKVGYSIANAPKKSPTHWSQREPSVFVRSK